MDAHTRSTGRERYDDHGERHRFPKNPVEYLPADYQLTDRDRKDVEQGTAKFIRGWVLEWLRLGAVEAPGEYIAYLAALATDPTVIVKVVVPDQEAGSGWCRAAPDAVLRANREARRQGLVIIAGAHSHKTMGSFTSGTDFEQHERLASENVGRSWCVLESVKGAIELGPSADEPPLQIAEMRFPGSDDIVKLKIAATVRREDLLDAQLDRPQRILATCFMTTNERGEHLFPRYVSRCCPACGRRNGEMTPAEATIIKVIGPTTRLSDEEREQVRQEIRDKVKSYSYWRKRYGPEDDDGVDDDYSGYAHRGGRDCGDPHRRTDEERGTCDATDLAVIPYLLFRRGQLVAEIPPSVIEQAAATTESLAVALGWKALDAERRVEKEGHGDSHTERPCD